CYVMSYDELYALFDKKGWIHSRDKEDYGIDNEAEELPTPISKPKSESQPESEKITPPALDSPKPVSKKVSPPVPPKPNHLKIKKKQDALIKLENKENRTKKEVKDYQMLYLDWITSGVDKLESSKPITKPPESNVYMDDKIEALFQNAKNLCEENGYDPEEFDGEALAIEIEDLSNHKVYDMKADPYHYSLNRAVQLYRDKSNRGINNMYTYTH